MQTSPTLGFIGLGVMGGPMCLNVVAKHPAPVIAFDLNEVALNEVAEAGARRASSIADLAASADVILLSLPGGKQVEAVCLGEGGIASAGRPGLIVVDLSTTAVAEARAIAARLAEAGIQFVDAPVARTRQAAQAGTLSIMVGAAPDLFAKVEPLLRYMGSDVTHCGGTGGGQVVKLINNALLFEHVAALAEMMVVAERAGVAPATLLEAVSKGSGDSFALRNHGLKAMLPREFPERSFPSEYVLKDLGYAIDLAKSCGVEPKMSTTAQSYYRAAVEAGFGPRYFPSIIELLDRSGS
ncbi:NAD(P)-dependent oxidoreductase [Phenylobacterium sp. LjRoot225]|uniref:NAD(P)-dependent oxidoreductase n=1 Tax=Phenylobacterium sp. LjRoot225 TaxID=3342285 RepID=UPI003ECFFBAA